MVRHQVSLSGSGSNSVHKVDNVISHRINIYPLDGDLPSGWRKSKSDKPVCRLQQIDFQSTVNIIQRFYRRIVNWSIPFTHHCVKQFGRRWIRQGAFDLSYPGIRIRKRFDANLLYHVFLGHLNVTIIGISYLNQIFSHCKAINAKMSHFKSLLPAPYSRIWKIENTQRALAFDKYRRHHWKKLPLEKLITVRCPSMWLSLPEI